MTLSYCYYVVELYNVQEILFYTSQKYSFGLQKPLCETLGSRLVFLGL